MRDVAAIVEPAVTLTQHERRITAAHVESEDATRQREQDVSRADASIENERRKHLAEGLLLVAARKAARHGEWLPMLARSGVDRATAFRRMSLAGWVDDSNVSHSESVKHLPGVRQLADVRKQSKIGSSAVDRDDTQPDPPPRVDPTSATHTADLDIDARSSESRILSSLLHTLGVVSREWPTEPQRLIAELRRYADKLERRLKDSV